MANKALRILESIRENTDAEVYDSMIKAYGVPEEKATPSKQFEYVKAMLCGLEHTCGAEATAKVMKPCGHQCISDGTIAKAKDVYKKAKNMDDFLNLLNERHIGGGKLHRKDGKIIGVYEKCYCGLPKYGKGMSPVYCNCSVGWFERLFSSVFEREVEVRKLQTILDGSDQCVFEITLKGCYDRV